MKIKLSWIPFIPAALAMVALRLLSVFGNDDTGTISGMNALLFSYLAVGVALVLFVLCIFFNILDKKTAPVYESKRNVPAGIFAVLSAAFALAYSVMTILTRKDSEYLLMSIICAFLAMLAAIGLVFMARTHFTGFAPVSNIAFLYIFPTLWAVSELISCFLEATKLSVSASDMSLLFCFIFLTLSLFPQAMVISKIPGRNPVKATFIYGLPSVAFGLSYGAFLIARVIFDSADGMALIAGVMFISFALYQLFYIIELTRGALKKDDVQMMTIQPITAAREMNLFSRMKRKKTMIMLKTLLQIPMILLWVMRLTTMFRIFPLLKLSAIKIRKTILQADFSLA